MPDYAADATPAPPVSFETSIKPLFRPKDRTSMIDTFDLWSYEDVKENAQNIYNHVASGQMPCDGRWPDANVTLFKDWMDTGMNA